ncbi:hypothetical protein R6Q59_020597 [Mikania micrantha]|uniref:F-box domain-containing protein n=1 Tax=Mikania micrantha TaxID=192012 RepID=A0A5N6PRK8_9ASTR|nr:hypothetical protein E3N88_06405 [Mikania micrantha]
MSDVPMPPDVLAQILSWLPVIALLRFRSVSKNFRALIDSDYVIKLHLNHSLQTNSNSNLIFGGDRSLCYLNLDSSANVVNKIHNPLYFAIFETVILGSCNGILCLCTTEPDNEIAFWNPLVRKFKKTRLAPVKCVEGFGRGVCFKGFGYDHVHDDHKVVRLIQYCNLYKELVHSKIEVFSLKNEAWSDIGDFPYHLYNRRYSNVFANGCLHWLVSQKPELKVELQIVAFDLTTDELRFVPQPDFANEKVQFSQVNLGILGGCLSMVCNYPMMNVDIWIMKSYGVKDSWSKLISTTDVKIIKELDFLRPIVYSKSGHEVLLEKNFERLYWYDLVNKTSKRLKAAGMPRLFVTEMFTGSLVQVNIGTASQRKKGKNENNHMKKKDDFLSKGFRLVL